MPNPPIKATTTVITGASSGIGAALALRFARRPGAVLGLTGRDEARLAGVAAACRLAGARVVTAGLDVRDRAGLAGWLGDLDREHPLNCVVANAGVAAGSLPGGHPERGDQVFTITDINYGGMLNLVVPAVPLLRRRRRGSIVLVSSLSAYAPLPDAAAYSASKAAVLAYGLALRQQLRPCGVSVCTVCPGFVTTPMSKSFLGWKPFEISAEEAARRIERGVADNRGVIAFPVPLALVTRLTPLVPEVLLGRVMSLFKL